MEKKVEVIDELNARKYVHNQLKIFEKCIKFVISFGLRYSIADDAIGESKKPYTLVHCSEQTKLKFIFGFVVGEGLPNECLTIIQATHRRTTLLRCLQSTYERFY